MVKITLIVKVGRFLLKIIFFTLTFMLLSLMIAAVPLGFYLFFFERISEVYTFKSNFLIELLSLRIEICMGFLFTAFSLVYVLCFLVSFKRDIVSRA